MPVFLTRRAAMLGASSLLTLGPRMVAAEPAKETRERADAQFAALEHRFGGRLGVLALDTQSGARLEHRPDQRFPLCSTFKFLAAAAVLARVDRGEDRLDRSIAFGEGDLDSYAPVAKTHLAEGRMSLSELCAAALIWSDNTAANLLLRVIGGPQGLTLYARSLGDGVTRLDRIEPDLNTAIPGDDRDITSPAAMVGDMRAILLGNALSPASRRQLETWMVEAQTGPKRIRAGVPASWQVGDKTGSGDNATANVIAILRPPKRVPILVAVYYTQSTASKEERDAVHAEIGRMIVAAL